MFSSIRSRLLGLVLATIVPLTALIACGLWSQWHADEDLANERAVVEARLLAAKVDDHLGNLESLLAGLRRAVSTNPADMFANDALLWRAKNEFESEFPGLIGNLQLFLPDGTDIGRSTNDPKRRAFDVRDRKYFQQILAGQRLAVGDVVRGRVSGQWVMQVGRSIDDQAGRLRAILSVSILLQNFQNALKVDGLPPGSIVTIVNEHGTLLTRNVDFENWVGRDVSNLADVSGRFAAKEMAKVVVWSDNVERMTGSALTQRAPWLVSVGMPTQIAFAAMVQRLSLSALFVTIAGITAFGIAWMLSGRIVRPLRQLGKDASVLASGELSHRTAIATNDEVGAVATAFNRMASSLERRQEEAQRTANELRQAKDTLSAVIDASQVAIVCSDPHRRIVLWNHAAVRMFGHTAEEAVGQTTKIVPSGGHEQSNELFRLAIGGETIRDVELQRMRKDGSLVDVRVSAAPMYHPDGTMRGVAWAYEDITERKKAEVQLRRLAHFDPLTGLPNRLSLEKELGRRLSGDGSKRPTAVALFDLDDFKEVNDMLGHSAGDELLIEVGNRLNVVAESYRWVGPVCRLGGDEFVVVMPDCGDPRIVTEVVEAMLKRVAERIEIGGQILQVAGCAGIAIGPGDGATVNELIANADLALYQAKSVGGRTHRLFLPVMRADAQARRVLTSELQRAFEANEFELYFQPQIRLADNAVVGAEALLRWRHPERGILAPGAFIDALADSAVAPDVGRWILRTSCQQMSSWHNSGMPLARIGVNLFPIQAHGGSLITDVKAALHDSGLPPGVLELEITENVALNYQDSIDPLKTLHDLGVKLAFDDFGTGYASLSYLTRLPLARIKIDRSFVMKVTEDAENSAIVRSLIVMAHNLGLEVIAEGVETESQASFLRNERCEEAQGYLYAKPLPVAEFEDYVRSRMSVRDAGSSALRRA
jgi:diguanylate cyclase (GGDEF)-like protein/PAS domain S-box-containing protein